MGLDVPYRSYLAGQGSAIVVDTGAAKIEDDDSATVTVADASADEGDAISFTVTLDEAVEGGLAVTPSFTDVTATKGTDYTENTAALNFAGTRARRRTFTGGDDPRTAPTRHSSRSPSA